MMSKTALVAGIERSSFDGGLVGCMPVRSVSLADACQMPLRIAIRNEDGEIYRVIGANGSEDFFQALSQLTALNFFDELSDPDRPGDGYHAIFVR
ncbi:hypothetical protein PQR62_04030 [Herbaspirillum lusitanum]|uniref:KTSC domain-containing protein n=1 Tax=Herbaspirillum lusitanum TaxID=213312 RepID=A0ABW9A6C2_9BURK